MSMRCRSFGAAQLSLSPESGRFIRSLFQIERSRRVASAAEGVLSTHRMPTGASNASVQSRPVIWGLTLSYTAPERQHLPTVRRRPAVPSVQWTRVGPVHRLQSSE